MITKLRDTNGRAIDNDNSAIFTVHVYYKHACY